MTANGPLIAELRDVLRSAEDRISADLTAAAGRLDGTLRLAIRKALEDHIIPCVTEAVSQLEARLNEKTDLINKKLLELERVSLALSEDANKQPSLTQLLQETLAPLSEPETLKGLINSGDFEEAICLALSDEAVLEELVTSEVPDTWVSQIPDDSQKKEFAIAIAKQMAINVTDTQKIEWVMELVLGLRLKDRNFLEELAQILSAVDSGADRKTQAKLNQCLKMVRSFQW